MGEIKEGGETFVNNKKDGAVIEGNLSKISLFSSTLMWLVLWGGSFEREGCPAIQNLLYKKKNHIFLISNIRKSWLNLPHYMLLSLKKYILFSWSFNFNNSFLFFISTRFKKN